MLENALSWHLVWSAQQQREEIANSLESNKPMEIQIEVHPLMPNDVTSIHELDAHALLQGNLNSHEILSLIYFDYDLFIQFSWINNINNNY